MENNSCPPRKGLVGLFAVSKYFRRAVADAVKIISIAIAVSLITFTIFLTILSYKGIIVSYDRDKGLLIDTCNKIKSDDK